MDSLDAIKKAEEEARKQIEQAEEESARLLEDARREIIERKKEFELLTAAKTAEMLEKARDGLRKEGEEISRTCMEEGEKLLARASEKQEEAVKMILRFILE